MASKAKKTSNLRPLTPAERERVGEFAQQHGTIVGFDATLNDAGGGIGSPLYRAPFLTRLETSGAIGAGERAAGEEFGRIFRLAHLDGLRAFDPGRISGGRPAGDFSPGSERARRLVGELVTLLGGFRSPGGAAAWHILGNDLTLHAWCARENWSGRPIRDEIGKGVVIAVLGALRQHFDSGRRAAPKLAPELAPDSVRQRGFGRDTVASRPGGKPQKP